MCTKCNVPLIEKLFGQMENKLYCDGCYEDLFGIKCDACLKPFRAGQLLDASIFRESCKNFFNFLGMKKLEWDDKQWHEECFKCMNCDAQIGCNTFMPKDNIPYCGTCFNNLFAPKCASCSKVSFLLC